MTPLLPALRKLSAGDILRRLLLSWLLVCAARYTFLPDRSLTALATADGSLALLLALTLAVFALLTAVSLFSGQRGGKATLGNARLERWALLFVFLWYAALACIATFTPAFFLGCAVLAAILAVYAVRGAELSPEESQRAVRGGTGWKIAVVCFAAGFAAFVSAWTVMRVLSLASPTYDMGIFTQMFHSMKTTGLPVTTLERSEPLSHFSVHVSPIYYLLLPIYALFPSAATLQVLQALVLASAALPLWLIARRRGFSPLLSAALCLLLLLYPALSGGTSYDLHENAFLMPLLLWLFYFIERRATVGTAVFALLTLLVKEDAAVYVAVIALWLLLRGLIQKDRHNRLTGALLFLGAIAYFIGVSLYLTHYGEGVMSWRYSNLMPAGEGSLLAVLQTTLLSPLKMFFECMNADKMAFLFQTMLPLLFLPLITRRYERLVLLIPYLLVNLMSDYPYQHDVFFQYTFGSTACLIYLTVVNLSELKMPVPARLFAAASAVLISAAFFFSLVFPRAMAVRDTFLEYQDYFSAARQQLSEIPPDAAVAATTFYTVPLAQRSVLYDLSYCTWEQVFASDYVILDHRIDAIKRYSPGEPESIDRKEVCELLESNGFRRIESVSSMLIYYRG